MATKTYELTRKGSLHTNFMVDKNKVFVDFIKVQPNNPNAKGVFVTNDKELQKAIETDNSFDVLFRLVKVHGKDDEKKETEKTVDTGLSGTNTTGKTEVPEVNTVQEAKNYLLDKIEGLTHRDVSNKEKVLEVAEANGYVFPNVE